MIQVDLDEAIRSAFEQRSNRPAHDTRDDPAANVSDEGRRSGSCWGRPALAACLAFLVLAAGFVLLRVVSRNDSSVTVDTPGEIAPFEPDLTTLPYPKYYRGGGSSTSGSGSLISPWQPHHEGEPLPPSEHVSTFHVYENDASAATVVAVSRAVVEVRV